MYDSDKAHALLTKATEKLIELRQKPGWDTELPPRFPPLLYSGNARTDKPRVLTVAANPSRQEFLKDSSEEAIESVEVTGDFSKLRFLDTPRSRPLKREETLEDLRDNGELQAEVLESNNEYFQHNPYWWFGKDKPDSYNVEGFLRGFGASYFESAGKEYKAIQIDLFPFATLADFNTLEDMASRDLFEDGWAQRFMSKLLALLKPELLIVFGRSNADHFGEYIDQSVENPEWIPDEGEDPAWYSLSQAERLGIPTVLLSTNLGNPRPFSAPRLQAYGRRVRERFDQWV